MGYILRAWLRKIRTRLRSGPEKPMKSKESVPTSIGFEYANNAKLFCDRLCLQLFQLMLSRSKAKRSNMSVKSLLGVAIKNTNIERNLVSRGFLVAIYMHKKARSNFKFSGKPMNVMYWIIN